MDTLYRVVVTREILVEAPDGFPTGDADRMASCDIDEVWKLVNEFAHIEDCESITLCEEA